MTKLRTLPAILKKAAGVLALPALAAAAMAASTAGGGGCTTSEPPPGLKGQVHLTLLHTSDIHSRLFPYNLQIGQVDAGLGLGAANSIVNVGGVARISHILGRERTRATRVLHLDGGDCFQGAPIFNYFNGEAEIRAMSAMGTDAMIVANHEFDRGALNLGIQLQNWADFPVLAANYLLEDPSQPGASPLGAILQPFTVFNLDGLKVGVVGMGNLSSITSIFEAPNRLGITPLNTREVAQFYIDLIRPAVDVVVFVTHLGLEVDEAMIANTTGIDVVLGGHNHIVLQPPKAVRDCSSCYEESCDDGSKIQTRTCNEPPLEGCKGPTTRRNFVTMLSGEDQSPDEAPKTVRRYCTPRDVVLAHSGAFAKYVGRLDLVLSNDPKDFEGDPDHPYDALNGFETLTHEYQLFPVTENEPQDPIMVETLQPYAQGLDATANLDLLVGYALDGSRRFSTTGGDSPLGNMIATAAWLRLGIQTDFSLTNTTGIRADLVPGPVTVEQMFNIFPFDNSITKMQLSGVEVQDLFDFAARRSSGRGCVSQVQIAGARVVMDCTKLSGQCLASCGAGDAACTTDSDCCSGDCAGNKCTALSCSLNDAACQKGTDCCTGNCAGGKCAPASSCQDNGRCYTDSECCFGVCQLEQRPGAATHIYIGASDKTCSSDKDCGGEFGSCDNDANGSHRCWVPIVPTASYELATSNYLAQGGSGFRVLQRNTTQFDTQIQQRDALVDYIRAGAPCGADDQGQLTTCTTDADCKDVDPQNVGAYACACPDGVNEGSLCTTKKTGCAAGGQCVLAKCRDDVAAFQRGTCEAAVTKDVKEQCETALMPCAAAGEQCKYLACVDRHLGNFSDGRLHMVGQ